MADTRDLKSLAEYLACGFESRSRHQIIGFSVQLPSLPNMKIIEYCKLGLGDYWLFCKPMFEFRVTQIHLTLIISTIELK